MILGSLKIVGSICKRCGKPYYLTARRIEWYRGMGFELPKRCPECLRKRKEVRQYHYKEQS